MEQIELETESYLFESERGQFRTIPFYELSIDEWVVFLDSEPKYLLDFNRSKDPIIKKLRTDLESGKDLNTCVEEIGSKRKLNLSTVRKIEGKEVDNSWQSERIKLYILTDESEL